MRGPNTCGYESCVCRGVHFICSYRDESDYCIDGKRVRVSDRSRVLTPSATEEQVRRLELYMLDNYADYLRARGERVWRREIPISPLAWTYPLKRYSIAEDGE